MPPMPENNFISLTGSYTNPSGNEAAYQAGTQLARRGINGIDEFRYGLDWPKDSTLQIDGKILTGLEDYLARFRLAKDEVGSVEVGYKRFRTYYDGVGGFFSNGNTWLPLGDEFLHVDRGTFWIDATLSKPNAPVFRVRYSNELRSGKKESTITGDTDMTGIPIWSVTSLNTISANRKLVPGFYDLGERHQSLEGTLTHTVGNTTIELRIAAERINNLDTRYYSRYPGELKPYGFATTPARLLSPLQANNQINGYDSQGIKNDTLSFVGRFDTILMQGVTLFGGATLMSSSGDLFGERLNTLYAAASTGMLALVGGYATGARPPYSYRTMAGDFKTNMLGANLGLDVTAVPNLHFTLALKGEQQFTRASNPANYISYWYDPVTAATKLNSVDAANTSRAKERAWLPELNLRYTGIKRITLFADADYRFSPGDEKTLNGTVSTSGTAIVGSSSGSDDKIRENHGSYKAGAIWQPWSFASVRAEAFLKNHHNGFYDNESAGGQYLLGYEQKGFQVAGTVKPLRNLSFSTKYSASTGNMWTTLDATEKYESMDSRIQRIGETVDWSPTRQLYLQASVNLVYDLTRTAYTRTSGIARDVVRDADNDYLTSSFVLGYALDDKTDIELLASHYRADNYKTQYSTIAYGVDASDSNYSIGVKRRFTKKLSASVKLGYIRYKSRSSGGFTDYKGTLACVSLVRGF
jgi:hypothetical protein